MLWLVAGGLPKIVAWLGAQGAVSKDTIEDYAAQVLHEKEMWLLCIRDRIRRNHYASEEAFRNDIMQIEENAIAYNSPNHGKCAVLGGFLGIVEVVASPLLKPVPAHTVVLQFWREPASWRKAP